MAYQAPRFWQKNRFNFRLDDAEVIQVAWSLKRSCGPLVICVKKFVTLMFVCSSPQSGPAHHKADHHAPTASRNRHGVAVAESSDLRRLDMYSLHELKAITTVLRECSSSASS